MFQETLTLAALSCFRLNSKFRLCCELGCCALWLQRRAQPLKVQIPLIITYFPVQVPLIIIYLPKTCTIISTVLPASQVPNYLVHGPSGTIVCPQGVHILRTQDSGKTSYEHDLWGFRVAGLGPYAGPKPLNLTSRIEPKGITSTGTPPLFLAVALHVSRRQSQEFQKLNQDPLGTPCCGCMAPNDGYSGPERG